MKEIVIDFIRHGEPIGGKKYRGKTDDALSELGWQQMTEMRRLIGDNAWQQVVCSDLCRCQDFARQVSEQLHIPLRVKKAFQEIDFGVWEGKSAQQIEQEFPHELFAYYQSPEKHTPQDAEHVNDFNGRVLEAWHDLIVETVQQNQNHVLFVAHAGVMRCILAEILQIKRQSTYHLDLSYACFIRLKLFVDGANIYGQLQEMKNLKVN